MREESDFENKNSMLDYLIALFEDVQDFSWDSAREAMPFSCAEWNRVK